MPELDERSLRAVVTAGFGGFLAPGGSAATLGVGAFRFISLFGPMPFSFAVLPRLRALGEQAEETPGKGTREEEGEPALRH